MASPAIGRGLAALLVLLCGAGAGCGKDDSGAEQHHYGGRVEGPPESDLSQVGVYVVRSGRLLPSSSTLTHPSRNVVEFDLRIPVGGPVALLATALPMAAPFPGESVDAALERARARVSGSRQLHLAGDYAGFLENAWPGDGHVIRMERVVVAPLKVRALGLDGLPARDLEVRLESRADWIEGRTGSDGVAAFDDVPVRPWRAIVQPPPQAWPNAVPGRATVAPDPQAVHDVTLRPAVVVTVRLVGPNPPGLFVAYGNAGEEEAPFTAGAFDEKGVLPVAADPDWKEVRIQLRRMEPESPYRWSSVFLAGAVVSVRPGATAEIRHGR